MSIKSLALPLLIAGTVAAVMPAADARDRHGDQDTAFGQRNAGQLRPLPEIESMVVPRMGGARYIGPEIIDGRYRLKFLRGNSLIWVDVDGRTGQILGRAGE